MDSSSTPGGDDLILTETAFERVKDELGITTWRSFQAWRQVHGVRTVKALRLAEFEEALAKSETRGQWRHSRPSQSKEKES